MTTVASLHESVSIELAGDMICARQRGDLSVETLSERHARICQLRRESNCTQLLLDDMEVTAVSYPALKAQQSFNAELSALGFHVAIVVPSCELAYLARIQFGDIPHRVFYSDLAAAAAWLAETKHGAAA